VRRCVQFIDIQNTYILKLRGGVHPLFPSRGCTDIAYFDLYKKYSVNHWPKWLWCSAATMQGRPPSCRGLHCSLYTADLVSYVAATRPAPAPFQSTGVLCPWRLEALRYVGLQRSIPWARQLFLFFLEWLSPISEILQEDTSKGCLKAGSHLILFSANL
jgi:hypothetical protein